jgi:uncharacterized membrane protein
MVFVVLLIVSAITSALAAIGIGFLIVGAASVGVAGYLLDIIRNKSNADGSNFDILLDGFKDSFVASLVAFILSSIFLFLWTLLFVIPGIVKSYSYSQMYFIIKQNPEIGPTEAIDESRKLMDGHKAELFWLDLSFIGWYFLGFLALGIGILFVIPYHQLARANFYNQLTSDSVSEWKEEFQAEF